MKKNKPTIPSTVWALGFVNFFINISTVMIFSFSAIYLKTILGIGTVLIGVLEGFVEAFAYLMKLFSGIISDYLQRRKRLIVLGYALLALSRPLLAISSTFSTVFLARVMDRFGNGIQATPRDALIGDIAPPEHRGACFGLRQALGTAGSFVGGILGVIAMWWTANNYHQVFWLATIPAVLALVILIVSVKDPKLKDKEIDKETHQPKKHPIHLADLKRLGNNYWKLMIVVTVFMTARVSEAFLILHATQNHGLDPAYSSIILICYNLTYSLASYPVGALSDRFGRYPILFLGFVTLILSDLVLFFSFNIYMVFIGVSLWGVQLAITQNTFTAKIADLVPSDLKGTGFGFFYLISAVASILSGWIGGKIAHDFDEGAMFGVSSLIAILALIFLYAFKGKITKKSK